MKIIHALIFILSLTGASAQATTLFCNGSAYTFGTYVNGNCSGGYCTAYLSGSSDSVSGNCGSGVTFHANSFGSSQSISGQCSSGDLSIYMSGGYDSWSGSCSNGSSFHGNSSGSGQYVTTTCQNDGSFSVYLPGSSVSISGTCQ